MKKISPQSLRIDNELFFANKKNPIGLYWLIIVALVVAILMTGVLLSKQTQERHQTYRNLQKLKAEFIALQVEEQRLRIEQQTFGSTPQVVRSSVDKLGMFFPTKAHRHVVTIATLPESLEPDTTKGQWHDAKQ